MARLLIALLFLTGSGAAMGLQDPTRPSGQQTTSAPEAAEPRQFFDDVLAEGGTVGVPAPVEQLHEADAALDQPPRQQAVVGERFLAGLGAVEFLDVVRLAGDVHDFGDFRLHAKGHFVLGNTCQDVGVAC
jgi:hypothetical protein